MSAKLRVATNMVEDQFIVAAVTGVASGQNANIQSGVMNKRAAMLIARPNFPSDHLLGGKGGPATRL